VHLKLGRAAAGTFAVGVVVALGPASAQATVAQLPANIVFVPCSTTALDADISAAVSGEQLNLSQGCDYHLGGALPDITTHLTIDSFGATLERDGDAADFTILTVSEGGVLNLLDVSFRDGGGSDHLYAGAIYNDGTVYVQGGTFTGNTSDEYGGAIYNDGTMTVTGASFIGNYDGAEYGGAIYNEDVMTVTNSWFSHNGSAYGGAIYSDDTLAVTGSTFTENVAIDGLDGYGGGIYNEDVATLTDDVFSGNDASYGGGALYSEDSTILSGVTIRGNSAVYGGGIYNDDVVTVQHSLIAGNQATDEGGGIYNDDETVTVDGSRITGNAAADGGGGIYNYSAGTVTLTGTGVYANHPDNCEPLGTITGCMG
jgi:predicted outer membrane repeat protein